jgi:isoleucyl-tRNA synthetase
MSHSHVPLPYTPLPPRPNFPSIEAEVLAQWKKKDTFANSNTRLKPDGSLKNEVRFYDGPPFATGLPHYGHLVGGTIKDALGRYHAMTGAYVERVFGWDCHGMPIENIAQKDLGVNTKQDIEALAKEGKSGVAVFNEYCHSKVLAYTDDWREFVEKSGRWVDMDHPYHTMDTSFMESVWGVFKVMHERGYIYKSYRVVPYSVGLGTSVSNFEANMDYRDRTDTAVYVKFEVDIDTKIASNSDENYHNSILEEVRKFGKKAYFLAWTTTPWTLPANTALAVGADIEYSGVFCEEDDCVYILASSQVEKVMK